MRKGVGVLSARDAEAIVGFIDEVLYRTLPSGGDVQRVHIPFGSFSFAKNGLSQDDISSEAYLLQKKIRGVDSGAILDFEKATNLYPAGFDGTPIYSGISLEVDVRKLIAIQSSLKKGPKTNGEPVIFYLSRTTLWREERGGKLTTLEMPEGTKRAVLEHLIDEGKVSADDLANELHKRPEYIRKEIGKLRKIVAGKFTNISKVAKSGFIPEPVARDGYKLHPSIELIRKEISG